MGDMERQAGPELWGQLLGWLSTRPSGQLRKGHESTARALSSWECEQTFPVGGGGVSAV